MGARAVVTAAKPSPFETRLRRWADAGLISEEQAGAIAAYERAAAAHPPPRVSRAIEALAYVSGVLLAVGAGMLVARYWDALGPGGRIGVLAFAAAATGAVGIVVGEADPVTRRLRGFLWVLSTAGTAGAAGIVAAQVLDLRAAPVALATAGAGAVHSASCWAARDRPLQHALTFGGLAVAAGAAVAWAGGGGTVIGAVLWALGIAWVRLARLDRVPPARAGILLGVALTLVACVIVGEQAEWLAPLAGLATAAAWVVVGVVTSEPTALAPGVLGVFVFLPWTIGYFFGETYGAPAVAMASGAALLAVVLVLVRRYGRTAQERTPAPGDERERVPEHAHEPR